MKKLCLTFDVEGFDIRGRYAKHSRLDHDYTVEGLGKILKLLRKHKVLATFFVTGEFYIENLHLIKQIAFDGHEIACHGYAHVPYDKMHKKEIIDDIVSATKLMRKEFDVVGFRCPQNIRFVGLYHILKKLDYMYSSSFHPAFLPGKMRQGILRDIHFRKEGVLEIPSSTFLGLGLSWLWFRLMGRLWSQFFLSLRFLFHDYSVLYFHPWEFVILPKKSSGVLRRGTGDVLLRKMDKFLKSCKRKRYGFRRMRDLSKDL